MFKNILDQEVTIETSRKITVRELIDLYHKRSDELAREKWQSTLIRVDKDLLSEANRRLLRSVEWLSEKVNKS